MKFTDWLESQAYVNVSPERQKFRDKIEFILFGVCPTFFISFIFWAFLSSWLVYLFKRVLIG